MMLRKVQIILLSYFCFSFIQHAFSSSSFDQVKYWAQEKKFNCIKAWLDEEKKMVDSLVKENLYDDTRRTGMQEAFMGMEVSLKSMEIEEYFRFPPYKNRTISKEDAEEFLVKVFKIVSTLCFKFDVDIFQKLELIFTKYPALLKYKDAMGWTLLHEAAHKNNLYLVFFLLRMGADANAKTEGVGDTPLHLAVRAHCQEVIYLLKHNSYVSRQSRNVLGEQPFDHRCRRCPFKVFWF